MEHTTQIINYLNKQGIAYAQHEPMSQHTSFRIGGPAELFITPDDQDKLAGLLGMLHTLGVKPVIIGKGSNLLVRDEGIDCPVIFIGDGMSQIKLCPPPHNAPDDKVFVWAQAGVSLSKLCRFCADHGLTGLEFAYGIPGTVGGAIYMNAGAYGGEIADVLYSSTHLTSDGKPQTFTGDSLDFSYRHSTYCERDLCITEACFALGRGDRESITTTMEEIISKRKEKQPLEWPSAGSTFKRPEGHYASALVDECGLKGLSKGGAQVSEKHAGFVINKGDATAQDVLTLIEQIKRIVKEKTGYVLECEVKLL